MEGHGLKRDSGDHAAGLRGLADRGHFVDTLDHHSNGFVAFGAVLDADFCIDF